MKNIKNLYVSQENVIKLFNNFSKVVSKAKYRRIHGERLKILTPKEMLQRLLISLAQAGNTSGNLLNEFRQIIYSLY